MEIIANCFGVNPNDAAKFEGNFASIMHRELGLNGSLPKSIPPSGKPVTMRSIVLDYIRENAGCTRKEIGEATGLNRYSVDSAMDRLIGDGTVTSNRASRKFGGRFSRYTVST